MFMFIHICACVFICVQVSILGHVYICMCACVEGGRGERLRRYVCVACVFKILPLSVAMLQALPGIDQMMTAVCMALLWPEQDLSAAV